MGNVVVTLFLLLVAGTNYPGGVAMSRLHRLVDGSNGNVTVHIGNFAAQSGVSRFTEINGDWRYFKEDLTPAEIDERAFSHLLVEAKSKHASELKIYKDNYNVLESVECFDSIGIQYKSLLPVRIKRKPCVYILERKKDAKVSKRVKREVAAEEQVKMETKEEYFEENKLIEDLEVPAMVEEIPGPDVPLTREPMAEVKEEVPEEMVDTDGTVEDDSEDPIRKDGEPNPEIDEETPSESDDEISGDEDEEVDDLQQDQPVDPPRKKTRKSKRTSQLVKEIIKKQKQKKEEQEQQQDINQGSGGRPQLPKVIKGNRVANIRKAIKSDEIRHMAEEIAKLDMNEFCDLDTLSTKECLRKIIEELESEER